MALEEFQSDRLHILTLLNFDEIHALIKLATTKYGKNSCYNYIKGVGKINGKYSVEIAIKPIGYVLFESNNLLKLLEFLKELFLKQPADMDYPEAGSLLCQKEPIDVDNNTPEEIWAKAPNL